MSIEKRATKNGQVRYDVRLRKPDGKQFSRTFRTKKEATAFEAKQIAEHAQGIWLDPQAGQITFEEWANEWYATGSIRWEPNTAEKNRIALDKHWIPIFGTTRLDLIKPRLIQQAVNNRAEKLKASTVRTYYTALTSLFSSAIDMELLAKSPCTRAVRLPADDYEVKATVTEEEVVKLADAITPEYRLMIFYAGAIGLRFGEVIALRPCDIDFKAGTVTVVRSIQEVSGKIRPKSVKGTVFGRTLSLPEPLLRETAELIKRLPDNGNPECLLFADSYGGYIRNSNFRDRHFTPTLKKVGIINGLTFHGLRHSAATHWAAAGVDARTTQHRLGHKTASFTLRVYIHASPKADRAAAQASSKLYWPEAQGNSCKCEIDVGCTTHKRKRE